MEHRLPDHPQIDSTSRFLAGGAGFTAKALQVGVGSYKILYPCVRSQYAQVPPRTQENL